MEQKQQRFSIGYVMSAFVVLLMIQNYFATPHTQTITYSQFKDLVQKGLVENLAIGEKIIRGTVKGQGVKEILPPDKLKDALPEVEEGKKNHSFNTIRVEDTNLTDELQKARIPFQGEISSNWMATILSWVVPIGLFFLLWSYLIKKMGGQSGLMQIGKSKAKVYIEKKTGVTFEELYEKRGRTDGCDVKDWVEAERLILDQLGSERSKKANRSKVLRSNEAR